MHDRHPTESERERERARIREREGERERESELRVRHHRSSACTVPKCPFTKKNLLLVACHNRDEAIRSEVTIVVHRQGC